MRRIFRWLVLLLFVAFVGRVVFAGFANYFAHREAQEMGGACRAFREGGVLENEYLRGCTDEILNRQHWRYGKRYAVAEAILLEMWDASCLEPPTSSPDRRPAFNFGNQNVGKPWCTRLPTPAQVQLALKAQWGGACERFLLSEQDAFSHFKNNNQWLGVRIRACLHDMKAHRATAWEALLERHWRLTSSEDWRDEARLLPTVQQIERALDVENRVFGIDLVKIGVFAALAASLAVVFVVARAGLRRAAGRRRTEQRKTETPKQEKQETPTNPAWESADKKFRELFDRHFDVEHGEFPSAAENAEKSPRRSHWSGVRKRFEQRFFMLVREKRLRSYKELWDLLQTFHRDSVHTHTTLAADEMDEIFKHQRNHFPLPKEKTA